MKIKKGDTVKVISGKNLGKEGKVLKVYPKINKVIVEGVNKIKKHAKPTQSDPDGGIREFEAPFHASNVMYSEKKTGTTKIGSKVVTVTEKKHEVTRKVRYSKKSGEVLD